MSDNHGPGGTRTLMIVTFDVTLLDEDERDVLATDVSVQAEANDDDRPKRDVPYPEIKFVEANFV